MMQISGHGSVTILLAASSAILARGNVVSARSQSYSNVLDVRWGTGTRTSTRVPFPC